MTLCPVNNTPHPMSLAPCLLGLKQGILQETPGPLHGTLATSLAHYTPGSKHTPVLFTQGKWPIHLYTPDSWLYKSMDSSH